MNSKFELAIFDCDGVLFDSKEANRAYYNRVLSEFGLDEMDEDELSYCHMHTAAESLRYLFRNDLELLQKASVFVTQLDYSDFLEHMKMEPGVVDTLENIRPPLLTAVSTNRSTTMPKLIEIYGLDRWFDSIVCALDVSKPKPNSEGVQKILDTLGADPGKTIYIGDSIIDEMVADRAGLPLIAYKNRNLKALFHVEHFNELTRILLE